ncbi:DUF4238 domain-containing protein [Sulfurimonas sp. HSL1-2]|uniref:DUF4238 domain-containing protein n=1 Tax=Thiomicrolovo zhangzhouensis TaxID=3131933 RepID=UPI0031F9F809
MANRKNQHFVPQYYFRYFSKGQSSINVLLKDSGKIIENAPIKGQCSKNNFYGSVEIESLFSKIEGRHSAVLKKIQSINSKKEFIEYATMCDEAPELGLNPDLLELLQAIMFQKSRTEFEAKKHSEMFGQVIKEVFLKDMELQVNDEILKYKEFLDISTDLTDTVLMTLEIATKRTALISDLGIYILKNKTSTEFIFSDAPVVIYNKYYQNVHLRGVLGLQSPGLMIFYPITPDTCILLLDEAVYHGASNFVEITNTHDIASINKLQLHHSLNAIYFSENVSPKYIRKLWKQQRHSFRTDKMKVVVASALDHKGNDMGEVMHSYEPQIPYSLNLSFITSEVRGDKDYDNSYRNPELIAEVEKEIKPSQQ